MGKANNVWAYLARHKYLITIVLGLLLVGLLDENSFRKYMILQMEYNEAKSELDTYIEQYKRDSVKLHAIEANVKGVERVARERYFMKRANEDVFVLSTDERSTEAQNDEQ